MEEKKKTKKKSSIIYKIIIVVLVLIIGFCAYKIADIMLEYRAGTIEYSKVAEIAGIVEDQVFDGEINFKALREENKDVKAWLYSEGTVINYPVVQGDDNQYYLYRMVNGEWNGKGSLFIDYRCENPFSDFNTIIYGHRMKDGSMFNSLTEYRSKSYFNEHKEMMLITPNKKYDVKVFGVVTIPADSDKYKFSFSGDSERQSYIDWIKANSEIDTGVSATTSDKLVMLSTCTYEFEEARLVVYGKLVEREDE